MKTSNYAALKLILPPMTPISISRGKPRWMKSGWLAHCQPGTVGRNYDLLGPTAASLKASEDEYDRSFAAQLAALDPRKVYDELGEHAVLLCFCEAGTFCHRRIVAEWLEAALNIEVPELGEDPDGNTELWTTKAYAHYMTLEQKASVVRRAQDAWQQSLRTHAEHRPQANLERENLAMGGSDMKALTIRQPWAHLARRASSAWFFRRSRVTRSIMRILVVG